MTIEKFSKQALSPWMYEQGPEDDIVLSTRIRLARNSNKISFPKNNDVEHLRDVSNIFKSEALLNDFSHLGTFELIEMKDLQPLEKRVLVEKHLISPLLEESSEVGACFLSEMENISIMINEEDHIRIQCLTNGLQLQKSLELASEVDDILEKHIDYAFDETRGYLTTCPTNVGTGLRASVMMHLPGLVLTKQLPHIIPSINQLGFVVRGLYGEGSEAQGNIFQISNQITLGKSEEDICRDLEVVVLHLVKQEQIAREMILRASSIALEDRIYRSLGILSNARILGSKEAADCLSDVRLGIDLGIIKNLSKTILNELLILTQPGFLQLYFGEQLHPKERDVRRSSLIREKIKVTNS